MRKKEPISSSLFLLYPPPPFSFFSSSSSPSSSFGFEVFPIVLTDFNEVTKVSSAGFCLGKGPFNCILEILCYLIP